MIYFIIAYTLLGIYCVAVTQKIILAEQEGEVVFDRFGNFKTSDKELATRIILVKRIAVVEFIATVLIVLYAVAESLK